MMLLEWIGATPFALSAARSAQSKCLPPGVHGATGSARAAVVTSAVKHILDWSANQAAEDRDVVTIIS
jgi:hypothetical protein